MVLTDMVTLLEIVVFLAYNDETVFTLITIERSL